MKNLTILIGVIALVLSSCGTHKALRFVKTNPNQQIVQTQDLDATSEDLIPMNESHVSPVLTTQSETSDVETDLSSSVISSYPDTTKSSDEPEMSSDEASDAVQQATRTEKTAKIAKSLGIAGIVTMWLGPISFVALPLMIATLILYLKASKARYNTEQGVKSLKTAKSLLLFYGIVTAVALLLTIVLIILILLFF
jgi:hypothetical protein